VNPHHKHLQIQASVDRCYRSTATVLCLLVVVSLRSANPSLSAAGVELVDVVLAVVVDLLFLLDLHVRIQASSQTYRSSCSEMLSVLGFVMSVDS
jgi:hypothetical protein